MTIQAGSTILAADVIDKTTGASDAGKLPKTNALGKLNLSVIETGSNGSDGALTITSGTTNIDVGGVAVFIKNYTSISITGTGALTFSNPHAGGTIVILKYNDGFVCTSSASPAIDVSSMGGAALTAGNTNCRKSGAPASPTGATGTVGGVGANYSNNPFSTLWIGCGSGGATGLAVGFGASNPGGPGGASSVTEDGSTGNNGSSTSSNSSGPVAGVGGRGGGGLVIIGDGAINFTGIIWAKGANGGNHNLNGGTDSGVSGGSGGGGGSVAIIGDTITSMAGSIVVTAGSAGTSAASCGTPGTSAAGFSFVKTKAQMN